MATADVQTVPGVLSFHDVGLGTGLKAEQGMAGIMNVNGTMTKVDDAGTQTALGGGGGGSGFVATQLARAAAISATLTGWFYDDFENSALWIAGPNNAAGTLKYNDATNTTFDPSALTLGSGGGAGVGHAVTVGNTGSVKTPKTTPWYYAWRAKFPFAADANDNAMLEMRIPGSSPHVQFGIRGVNSLVKWTMTIGNVDLITASGATSNIDQLVHLFEVWFDGTNVVGAVDGTNVTTTATLTNLSNSAGGPSVLAQGTDSVVTVVVDKLFMAFPQM